MTGSVAFCVDNLNVGGTELNAVRTAGLLRAAGVPLRVYAMQSTGPLRIRYDALGVEVVPIPLGGSLTGLTALRQGFRFARLLRSSGDAILHCHDRYSNVFGAFWGRMAGTAAIITSRRWDQREGSAGLRRLNRLAFRASAAVVANSERVQQALTLEDGVPPGQTALIPNFVEADAFERPDSGELELRRRAAGLPPELPVVGIVANLRPVKDHDLFLRMAALVAASDSEVHFAIIGEGDQRERLERETEHLGLVGRVHFLGMLPNRPNPFQLVDIATLTSRTEGFPNSILEAMAAGRPVVATEVGGVPDAVVEGVTGFMVPHGAAEPFAAAVSRLLSDPGLARRCGEAGRRLAGERFSEIRVLADLQGLYERVLTRGSAGPL
ncbi:MAG TPA: glycosyltransferase [Gemmatimonadales bacterium]|nr:glycosyltransferase [Gemmatimonadales bacterium]